MAKPWLLAMLTTCGRCAWLRCRRASAPGLTLPPGPGAGDGEGREKENLDPGLSPITASSRATERRRGPVLHGCQKMSNADFQLSLFGNTALDGNAHLFWGELEGEEGDAPGALLPASEPLVIPQNVDFH